MSTTWVKSDTGPFAIIPEWVLCAVVCSPDGEERPISDRAIRLYCLLARYADAKGESWPRRKVLAERLGCSLASLDRACDELILVGALSVAARFDEGGQRANLYVVYRACPYASEKRPVITDDEGPPITGDDQNETQFNEIEAKPPPTPPAKLRSVPNTASPTATGEIRKVFDAWIEATGRTSKTVLDAKRRRLITRALNDYPLDDVLDAVRGWKHSPHHCGDNDAGKVYNELDLLLRDAGHIERFRDLWRDPPRRPRSTNGTGVGQAWEQVVTALQRGQRPTFDDRTERAIAAIGGWQALRVSANQVADRAHFIKFWEAS